MITDREKFLMFEAVQYHRQRSLKFIEQLDVWLCEPWADGEVVNEDALGQIADSYTAEQKDKKEQLKKDYPYKIKSIN